MKKLSAFLAAVALTTACFSTAQKQAVDQAALQCSEKELATIIPGAGESLGLYVLDTILGGAAGWATTLEGLATTYGPGLVNCAIQIADAYFTTSAGSGSAVASAADGLDFAGAKARAEQYLATHPITAAK